MSKTVKRIKVMIGDKMMDAVTATGLAAMLGISPQTIRVYEQRGLLPVANYRMRPTETLFDKKGKRLYSIELAKALVPIFQKEINRGTITPDATKQKIKDLFTNERLKYAKSTPT